ncbi:MAG: hypothetical protein SLAVMIC_00351 [uncultured marine phage]|uniref:Uncharacterized protein n=1 Tax=uncultured marine phage TaxID=707152 RepID=A0A8D9CF11_9VIRU|nr:MAG: hypothetical protein SLAVMIC_00351 [uncultured marine phage]
MPINEKFNWDDVFMRDLTVCVLATMEDKIRWTNVFESGPKDVNCKIYYSLTGSEDYLMDSFVDDIASTNRFVELNTDAYPRGHITMTGWNIRGDEFANPNVWLKMVVENQEEIKNVIAKVRALPISAQYELSILVNSEIDTFKASQAIMNTMWMYKYMYFEHNFMNIDAVIVVPDDQQVEITREHNLNSQSEIKLTLTFEIQSYYPAFNENVTAPAHGSLWTNQIRYVEDGKIMDKSFKVELKPSTPNYDVDNTVDCHIKLSRTGSIKLKVFDHMARVLNTYDFPDRYDAGEHVVKLDISDKTKYTTGIYYVKVEIDDEQLTTKMEIDRP